MDFTYIFIIIGGNIKKIKNKFILDGGHSHRAETVRN